MKTKDDFNWETYTSQYYEKEMEDIFINKLKQALIITDVKFKDGEIDFVDDLHVNWKELYHTINKLGVKSIYECGCGCAHHLINSQIINPELVVNGSDYSRTQIDIGVKRFNLNDYEFANRLKVVDMVNIENVASLGKHEFVYTQAVTMHLSFERAKKFLTNMKELSSKYVYLIENITSHDYNKLILDVFPEFEIVDIRGKFINYGILLKRK